MCDWCVTLSMQYLHKKFNMVRINIESKNVENALTNKLHVQYVTLKNL